METSSAHKKAVMHQFRKQAETMWSWYAHDVKPLALYELVPDEAAASHTAVFSADMIKGFCKKGNLASPRVDAISAPIADLFTRLYKAGVRTFALIQEWHRKDAKEFAAYPPHGIEDTDEAETVSELLELPFAKYFTVFRKNALTPAFSFRTAVPYDLGRESFELFLRRWTQIRTAIVVGNCTDLCTRELAMYLRMFANEHQRDMRVIIPENCAETFDLSHDIATSIGAMPHPGDLYHIFALYEMARNKIEIVREIR